MNNYIFIEKLDGIIKYGKVENSKLTEYYCEKSSGISQGNIYRARVVKKVTSLNCFFVEIEKGIDGFLDFRDVVGEIKCGDAILVEVYKINSGDKAPNVTMNISISSDYTVIYYKNEKVKVSRKIKDVKFDLEKIEEIKENFCIKLRTMSEGICFEVLEKDIKEQILKMKCLLQQKNLLPVPMLVYEKDNIIRDYVFKNKNYECVLNNKEMYQNFKSDKSVENKLILDDEYRSIYDYNISREISTLNEKSIEIDGINIVIENFEALTVIDINSKKVVADRDKSKNSLMVNEISLNEIVRQISFRDISGIILIDFINMKNTERLELERKINKIKSSINDGRIWTFYGFTKTGLYEITRQRGNNGNFR